MQLLEQSQFEGFTVQNTDNKKGQVWVDFIPPSEVKIIQVVSYGAGKQTAAMLVLIEQGVLPKPDLILFADTQQEKPQTYDHIEQFAKPICERIGVEFVRVTHGDLYQYCWSREVMPNPPMCTKDFKINLMNGYLKTRYNLNNGVHGVDSWIGITTDESHRNTPSHIAYAKKTFPLLDLNLSRNDCIELTKSAGYPVPVKSGCLICPNENWEKVYFDDPGRFEYGLNLERHAQRFKPYRNHRLPEFGRGLRSIKLNPKIKLFEYEDDSCNAGYCGV